MIVERKNEYCYQVIFEINYPDGIRNSNKGLKNLLKSSSELRSYVIEALRGNLQTNIYSTRRTSYAVSKTLGKTCYVQIYISQDIEGQPIEQFLDELLRKTL